MTDELTRLRDELRAAKPDASARARGVDAAMAAFEREYAQEADASESKNIAGAQGSDSGRRLTGQNASGRRDRPRRRSMSSRMNVMFGGTAVAAALAAFVVVPNIRDRIADPGPSAVSEIRQTEGDALKVAPSAQFGDDAKDDEDANLGRVEPAPMADAPAIEAEEKSEVTSVIVSGGERAHDGTLAPPSPPVEQALSDAPVAVPSLEAIAPPLSSTGADGQMASGGVIAGLDQQRERNSRAQAGQPNTRAVESLGNAMFDNALRSDSSTAKSLPNFSTQPKPAPADPMPNVYQDDGRDKFESVDDNPVKRTADEPVSTFSVDVDTASYSFMRASLNRGQLPDPSSIRIEELINYFPYDYAAPDSAQEPFKSNVTVTPNPWNADTKLMHIGIKGYTPPVAERPNSNIVLLIDTSGSMNNPNKLPLLINSFKLLLDTLGEDDTVSIVTYAGSAGTVLEPTPASERKLIIDAFDRLRAGGSTAGAAGLKLAYDKAQESFDENGINRVILATDGDFNVGFSSPDEMKSFVEKKRESGVFLSVLGFGMGNYNDQLMQTLAQNGNGVAAYIDTLSEARKVLADEAGGALIPIAKDVKIQVEFNPGQISEYRLIGYETRALKREDFNNDKVDAGEIGSGHTVTAIYEITPKGSPAELIDDLRYAAEPAAEAEPEARDASTTNEEYAFVKIRYKLPSEDTSTLITRPVTSQDEAEAMESASDETRFAASVAALGQLLRGGDQIGSYGYDDVIALATGAKGADEFGYRAEFVNLVRLAKSLDSNR